MHGDLRETTLRITTRYLHMDDGNTSKLVDDPGLTNFWPRGHPLSMPKNEHDA